MRICEEVWRRWLSHPSTVCQRHADCRTGPEEDWKFEEDSEQVIRDAGHGTRKADPKDGHSLKSDKEDIVDVIGEVLDNGAPEVGSTLPTNYKMSGK